jgi:hypothetical protein
LNAENKARAMANVGARGFSHREEKP